MKISIEQFNPKTFDFDLNYNYIRDKILKSNSDVLSIFPELSLSGMPLYGFIDHSETYSLASKYCQNISELGRDLIFGSPITIDNKHFNSLCFISQGELIGISRKKILGEFDNGFSSGNGFETITYKGKNIGFGFLDDFYEINSQGLNLAIISSNIVFSINTRKKILEKLIIKARKLSCSIILINRIGGEGGYIFSGESFFISPKGEIIEELNFFENDSKLIETENQKPKNQNPISENEILFRAMVFSAREYFNKNRIKKAVLGLSGGIDSALVAVIASYALGKENITGLIMPSEYSSDHSIKDAEDLANNIGIKYHIIPIKDAFNLISSELNSHYKSSFDVGDENLQSRIRCLFLMWFANKQSSALLNTTNKSEMAVGYGTLYGDTSGAISVIGDLLKTQVWEVSKWINQDSEIIPYNSINKPPSAELRPGQKDLDSLPDYNILDRVIIEYLENNKSNQDIISEFGFEENIVDIVIRLIKISEWKRRQCPIPIKLSNSCFGLDIKLPIS